MTGLAAAVGSCALSLHLAAVLLMAALGSFLLQACTRQLYFLVVS